MTHVIFHTGEARYCVMKVNSPALAAVFLILFLSACTSSEPSKRLIKERCSACHSTKRIFSGEHAGRWETIIDRMIRHGARLDKDERREILEYLRKSGR